MDVPRTLRKMAAGAKHYLKHDDEKSRKQISKRCRAFAGTVTRHRFAWSSSTHTLHLGRRSNARARTNTRRSCGRRFLNVLSARCNIRMNASSSTGWKRGASRHE